MSEEAINHPDRATPQCPACSYDVRAQLNEAGATCPECGRFVAPGEIVWKPARRSIDGLPIARWMFASGVCAFLLFEVITHSFSEGAGVIVILLWMSVCVVGGVSVERANKGCVTLFYRITTGVIFILALFFAGAVLGAVLHVLAGIIRVIASGFIRGF